jgi:hypothetical protein
VSEPPAPGAGTDSQPPGAVGPAVVERAFGEENRGRLLRAYFEDAAPVTDENAWAHAYRLLLWIDRTTGLAHCYESDKCQPGRPWYARSLAFHVWLAEALGTSPSGLADEIDVLFKKATGDLAAAAAARRVATARAAEEQREAYRDRGMPLPGEDPELEAIIQEILRPYLAAEPPPEVLRNLTERIQAHVGQENKRKNLVGEGFEDAVAALLERLTGLSQRHEIKVRPLLHELPGFHPPRGREKPRQVDLALISREHANRVLVSCKWSVRSDREEQFSTDYAAYTSLEAMGEDFEYVLVTNEFDPARLAAACDNRAQGRLLFTHVVHMNPDGPRAAYSAPVSARARRGGIERAIAHMDSGRLMSFQSWLGALAAPE